MNKLWFLLLMGLVACSSVSPTMPSVPIPRLPKTISAASAFNQENHQKNKDKSAIKSIEPNARSGLDAEQISSLQRWFLSLEKWRTTAASTAGRLDAANKASSAGINGALSQWVDDQRFWLDIWLLLDQSSLISDDGASQVQAQAVNQLFGKWHRYEARFDLMALMVGVLHPDWLESFRSDQLPVARSFDLDRARLLWQKQLATLEGVISQGGLGFSAGLDQRLSYSDASLKHSYQSSFSAQYEIDIFNRLSDTNRREALLAQASEQDIHAVQITLASAMVSNYWRIAYLKALLDLQQERIKLNQRKLEGLQTQLKLGRTTDRALDEFRLILEQDRATDMNYRQSLRQSERDFLLLLSLPIDQNTEQIFDQNFNVRPMRLISNRPVFLDRVPREISSEVLWQRPDIMAQTRRLEASFYEGQGSKNKWLPHFFLSTGLGTSTIQLARWLSSPSSFFGAALSLPFISVGAVSAANRVINLTEEINQKQFEQSVWQSAKEAFDALEQLSIARKNWEVLHQKYQLGLKRKIDSSRSVELGEQSEQDFLERAFSLNQAQSDLLAAQITVLNTYLSLYKALGGARL